MSWRSWIATSNNKFREQSRWRECCAFDADGPNGIVAGKPVISFASNDYLGLTTHPAVRAAAHAAIDRWGTGASASRLVTGTRPIHHELEHALAAAHQVERTLLFSSGYAANLGALTTLGGEDVTIFSDELNHASIIDGCKLSRARTVVYRHCDSERLQSLLESCNTRKLIVTESIFSMDGDRAPLRDIARIAAKQRALLVIDDAHNVFPDHQDSQLDASSDYRDIVRIGTLSKTLGAMGGWVGGSQSLIEMLINSARSFIFTTALAPADAAAALAALNIYSSIEGLQLRARLRRSIGQLRSQHDSPIVPFIIGNDADALRAAQILLEHGVYVPAIRPPTVAAGTARLRVTLSAAHDDAMLGQLKRALISANISL